MNKNNNNTITPHKTLTLLNNAFKIIIEKEKYYMKNSKSPIDLDTIKSLYEGFYAGFKLLLELSDLPYNIKSDLIAKKIIVDLQYSSNITYPEYNRLKNYKSFANKKLKYYKYLNQKAKDLTNLQALELKAKISELNNEEKKKLNNEEKKKLNQLKTNSNLAKLSQYE